MSENIMCELLYANGKDEWFTYVKICPFCKGEYMTTTKSTYCPFCGKQHIDTGIYD